MLSWRSFSAFVTPTVISPVCLRRAIFYLAVPKLSSPGLAGECPFMSCLLRTFTHFFVEKSTFSYLVSRLDATAVDVFYSSDGRPQLPVPAQFEVALYKAGHDGKGASVFEVA